MRTKQTQIDKATSLESKNPLVNSKHELKFQQSKSFDCNLTNQRKKKKSFYLKKFASMDEEASLKEGQVFKIKTDFIGYYEFKISCFYES